MYKRPMIEHSVFSHKLVLQLLDLHKELRGSIVRAEHGPAKKQLVVRQGRLAFAESNAPEDHLARVMVSLNLLPKSALAGVAEQMKQGKTSDEAILAGGIAGQTELEEGAREQALAVLSSLMTWEAGEIRLYNSEQMLKRRYDLALPLPGLIVAAVRRAAARRPAAKVFSPLSGSLAPASANREDLLMLPLDRNEAFAFSLVEGPSEVRDLLSRLGQEHAKPEELILRLLMLGLVRKGDVAKVKEQVDLDASDEIERSLEDLLRRSKSGDPYAILGVRTDASEQQIKEAYHTLARRFHPDRFQSREWDPGLRAKSQELFASVTGAYARLGDPASRSAYDLERTTKGRTSADLDRENMAEITYRAGQGFFSKGDYERAAEKLRECVWLKPGVAKYHYLLGASQAEVQKTRKEAEQSLLKAIELDRTMAEAHVALGKLYLKVGMARRAESQIREALRLNPKNAAAREILAKL